MNKHNKLNYKRTHMKFKGIEAREAAITFLLKMNIKFRAWAWRDDIHFIEVAPSNFIRYDLDLYLPHYHTFSTFKYAK